MKEINFDEMYKNIVENDPAPIMFIDTEHIIRYMNKSALIRYAHRGAEKLIGQSIFACHNKNSEKIMIEALDKMEKDNLYIGYEYYNKKYDEDLTIIAVRDDNGKMIGYYEKHESTRKSREAWQKNV